MVDAYNGSGEQFSGPILTGTGVSSAGNDASPRVLADSGRGIGATIPSFRFSIAANILDDNFFGMATGAVIRITDGKNFHGISQVFIADSGTNCDATAPDNGAARRAVATVSGDTATINVPANKLSPATLAGNVDFSFCVLADGSAFLEPRTFSASVDINVTGTGANDPAPTFPTAVQAWTLNGADLSITGVRANISNGNETVISINNLSFSNASFRRVEVFRLDGSTGFTPACVIAPIAGKTIFAKAGNTLRGTEINALCAAQASFLANEAYGVRLIIDTAPENISANSVRIFPDGRLLSLPVLKGSASGVGFRSE